MKKFSYIIPFNSTIDNINNLRRVIKWVNSIEGSEVIVVEYDINTSKLKYISDPFIHIYIKNDKVNYSNSWAYNVGTKRSNTDVIICGSSNLITNPNNIKKGLDMLDKYDSISFKDIIEIQPNMANDINQLDNNSTLIPIGTDSLDERVSDICHGITIYNRNSLMRLGGWEERFNMDKSEDFQSHKIKTLSNWTQLDCRSYRFPHSIPYNDDIVSNDVNIYNQLKSMDKNQLQRYIMTTYKNIGVKSKYE